MIPSGEEAISQINQNIKIAASCKALLAMTPLIITQLPARRMQGGWVIQLFLAVRSLLCIYFQILWIPLSRIARRGMTTLTLCYFRGSGFIPFNCASESTRKLACETTFSPAFKP
jgi:hypothetical protein